MWKRRDERGIQVHEGKMHRKARQCKAEDREKEKGHVREWEGRDVKEQKP